MLKNNFKGELRRIEGRNNEIHVGDIIAIGQHWTKGYNAECDIHGEYIYVFECSNLEGHEVDYVALETDSSYADEISMYGINADYFEEQEVIVPEQQYKVVQVYGREIDEFSGEYLPQLIIVERI